MRWILIGLATCVAFHGDVARATEAQGSPEDLAAIEARLQQIEQQLAETKALVSTTGGKSAASPSDLPQRFKQAELQAALRVAFKQVSPGAELTEVDCSEYPCIAIGNGIATSQLTALKATPALLPYQKDDLSLFVWEQHVAVIAAPKGDPALGAEGEQRILMRFHQMAAIKTSNGS